MHTHTQHTHTAAEGFARVSLFTVVTKGDNLPPDQALIHPAAVVAAVTRPAG